MKLDIIQIGANVGNNKDDPIWPLMQTNEYNVLFIEPLETSFEKLKENYKDKKNCYFENFAVLDYIGEVDLFYQKHQVDIDRHNQQASIIPKFWRNKDTIKVKCCTLNYLVEKYNMLNVPFYLLQIDAEKSDDIILLSTNFTNILPQYIRFESIHFDDKKLKEIDVHLSKFNYVELNDIFFTTEDKKFNKLYKRIF